jgi:hypothetical protein
LEASGVQAAPRNARINVENVHHDIMNVVPSALPCIATKERTSPRTRRREMVEPGAAMDAGGDFRAALQAK